MSKELDLYFEFKCKKGFDSLGLEGKEYQERLDYEIACIKKMGFSGYLLIVQDLLAWAKRNDILYGVGRGSAAGSLVCYVLRITQIDPIKHGLIFERFLNPDRVSMPDVDLDFEIDRREEVVDYVKDVYGESRVARITTFSEMQAKGAIRDVARAMDLPYMEGDKLSKLINMGTIAENLETNDDFKDAVKNFPHFKEPLAVASKLEGNIRHRGQHAAGVVIGDKDLKEYMPVYTSKKTGDNLTQFAMNEVESVGLIKFDFLGLKNLSIIHMAQNLIKERHGVDVNLDDLTNSLDDEKVFQLFANGDTMNIFQFESGGMRRYLRRLKPDCFDDIVAMNALYRPSGLDCIHEDAIILRRKQRDPRNNRRHGMQYMGSTIKQLYDDWTKFESLPNKGRRKLKIISVDTAGNFIENKINKVMKKGILPIVNVTVATHYNAYYGNTRSTQTLRATENHEVLTLEGFKKIKELRVGDYIAINNRYDGIKKRITVEKHIAGTQNFRNICFREYRYECVLCDWKGGSLDVNHLDENKFEDNSPENLSWMCPNHHRMFTEGNISADEIKDARGKHLLPRTDFVRYAQIIDMQDGGNAECYDISVEGPNNNYVADNFVVHNSGIIDDFIARKNDPSLTEYPHECMEPYLKGTFGLMVYQEDQMKICQILAGYTAAEADNVRRAIGKKKMKELKKERPKFVKGCMKKGLSKQKAEDLFDDLEKAGRYSFNASHSCSYSVIAYWTAWFKLYYPLEYMTSVLTYEIETKDDLFNYINEARKMGINFLPPDVNKSQPKFTIEDGDIRYALGAIECIGFDTSQEIVAKREQHGDYTSVRSLIEFTDSKKVTTQVVESLVKSGAFDHIDQPRSYMLATVEPASTFKKKKMAKEKKHQLALFERVLELDDMEPQDYIRPSKSESDKYEMEALGFYLFDNPLQNYVDLINRMSTHTLKQIKECEIGEHSTKNIVVGGYISGYKEVKRKVDGKPMAFLDLSDGLTDIKVCVFTKAFGEFGDHLGANELIMFRGQFKESEFGEGEVIANKATLLDDLPRAEDDGSIYNFKTADGSKLLYQANEKKPFMQDVGKIFKNFSEGRY